VALAAMAAVVLFGVFAFFIGQRLQTVRIQTLESESLPAFRIVERNIMDDAAVLSVMMGKLNQRTAKQVGRYLVEHQLATLRSQARIYFYREGTSLKQDEPQHELSWSAGRGYSFEY
jgi:hypothetical protein